MPDTVRTVAALQALLSDGAAAHSTNRQLIRDLLVSLDAVAAAYAATGDVTTLGSAEDYTDAAVVSTLSSAEDYTDTALAPVQKFPLLGGETGVTNLAYPYGDVRRFGADITGAVAADTAMSNAITSVGNQTIDLPAGTFTFASAITLATTGVRLRGAGRNATILKFTGATDGIVLADAVALARVKIENLNIQTTNAGGLNAIKASFPTSGGTEHVINDIAVTVSGSGRWAYGFFGNNFQTSSVYNYRVVQSATVGFRFENFSNSGNFYNLEVTGSSGVGTITRGMEVVSVTDIAIHGYCAQGYFTQSCIFIQGSGPRFHGGHLENTNGAPSDGADVVVSTTTSLNGQFVGMQGGSYLLGIGTVIVRNFDIIGGETAAIALSAFSRGCRIFTRCASIVDSNTTGGNQIWGCSDSTGAPLANKAANHFLKANTTTIPQGKAVANAVFVVENGGSLAWVDSTGALKETLFLTASNALFLDAFNSLTIRDQATATLIARFNVTGFFPALSANGATWGNGQASELLTLSTSGTTTDTTANLLPSNAIIEAVVARVTTTITTATDWKLGDVATSGRFSVANAGMTAGTLQVGTVHADQTGAAGPRQAAAAKVRVTTTGTPGAGAIRITVFYRQYVAPST